MKIRNGFLVLALGSACVQAETLDIMVLFNESARSQISDTDTWATQAVEFYNQALDNANISLQGRLVYAGNAPSAYNKSLTGNTELNEMIADSQIKSLKQQYGADVIGLITGSATNWCGYGKIIQGDGTTGQISQGQAERAVFWSKKSCGYKTFAHEVGHSMGLGHSYEQGSRGGMYTWARGHGEKSQWVTMMAYTSAYDVPSGSRLQVFSNPQVSFCQGSACGKDRSQVDGADAAGYINQVANQLVALTPAMDDNPNLPPEPCSGSTVPDNLVLNSDMDSITHWSAFPSSSDLGLSVTDLQEDQCIEKRLLTSQRANASAGVSQTMTGKLSASKKYKLSASGRLFLAGREDLKASLLLSDGSLQALSSVSVTQNEWTILESEFIPSMNSDQESVKLVFNMSFTQDFLLDKVSVVYLEDVEVLPPPDTTIPEWDKNTIYAQPGNKVRYQGKTYQNKWWTRGDIPGSQQWGPWEEV